MGPIDVLTQMESLGIGYTLLDGKLRVEGASGLTPELRAALVEHRDAVVETVRRVETFRQQVHEWWDAGRPGLPFLVLYDAVEIPKTACQSCGAPRGPRGIRCELCEGAASIVTGARAGKGVA